MHSVTTGLWMFFHSVEVAHVKSCVKGNVQRKLKGSKIVPIVAWDCGASRIEHIHVSGQYSENNRRSILQQAAQRCLHFAFSFTSLMLPQYYWCCNLYSNIRQSMAEKKVCQNSLLALKMHPASPIGMVSTLRFAQQPRG